jgi:diguanylate cyclase (GGDEF)-like protein
VHSPGVIIEKEATVIALLAAAGPAGFLAGLAAMRPRVRRAVTEAAHARWVADHDALTGLPNRQAARRHYQDAARSGRPRTVVLLDLDDFKSVNDTWGHHAGDAHLVAVAERLARSCTDIGAVACRLGGDEFVLMLPSANPGAAMRLVESVVADLAAPLPLPLRAEGAAPVVTFPSASAGVAVAGADEPFGDVLQRADVALYHAKRHRLTAHLHTPGLRRPEGRSAARRFAAAEVLTSRPTATAAAVRPAD